ncbi:MAG: TetR/AcrR family transcriptional regulator [Coriobacteriales bacterium]|jgi:hypothetical protein|nr:TetR/AcrR family transcriptional regulator [Coriobacteriales bacterium]
MPSLTRQTASRKNIKWATLETMKSKPLSDITISEVVRLANVSRATFYNYYTSIYDVVLEIENNFFAKMPKEAVVFSKECTGKIESFEECLKYEKENLNILKILLSKNGDPNFENLMIDDAVDFYQKAKLMDLSKYSKAERELITKTVVLTFWGPTRFWIFNDDAFTLKQIDKFIVKLINTLLELFDASDSTE